MDMMIIKDGLVVLCLGFSVVFAFLVVLIISMGIMSKIVAYLDKIFPVASPVPVVQKRTSNTADEEIAVAIAAAILKQGR
ncbi:MAG: OadG family protein [Candidatus Gastranaerophilales bacterium]|nr:OadG family protein [Candidatus Gastranaerophilales bacterium]